MPRTGSSHLVLVDIDHTLLSSTGDDVATNLAALERARDAGVTVVLATARSYIGALPVHRALELDTPLIVSNGTLVCDPDGEVIKTEALEPDVARWVVERFCGTEHHWAFRTPEAAFLHPEFDRHREHFRDTRHYRPTPLSDLGDVLDGCRQLLSASLFGRDLKPVLEAHDWQAMGLAPSYYPPSHYDYRESMSIISSAAGKGNAARWLQGWLGLESARVLAIGDSPDDASMFSLGTGVAPANAPQEVLAQAHWVACHCDEGAVAAALERFVFEDETHGPGVLTGECL